MICTEKDVVLYFKFSLPPPMGGEKEFPNDVGRGRMTPGRSKNSREQAPDFPGWKHRSIILFPSSLSESHYPEFYASFFPSHREKTRCTRDWEWYALVLFSAIQMPLWLSTQHHNNWSLSEGPIAVVLSPWCTRLSWGPRHHSLLHRVVSRAQDEPN